MVLYNYSDQSVVVDDLHLQNIDYYLEGNWLYIGCHLLKEDNKYYLVPIFEFFNYSFRSHCTKLKFLQ